MKAGYTLGHADVAILNELARIALASLEAEVVAWMWERDGKRDVDMDNPHDGVNRIGAKKAMDAGWKYSPLYTAPPATVSVPEWTNEQCMEFLSIAFRHAEINGDLQLDDIRLGVKMVNACRAAMLQGAENAETPTTMQTAPALYSSAKIAESPSGNSPVIPDGWVMVPVEPTAEMLQSGISAHYERSQIQIHDRPAPGPMECAYAAMLAAAPQQEVK
ncbi:hypothetical protein [Enterobacter mori]|uniref:hypothetical protein n=1 Tax=Enterobacter mori TaxID=539813 RepID=UPI001B8C517E|nr:hypothetical protein [Enterobacter mori]